jgi:hypothetical protein
LLAICSFYKNDIPGGLSCIFYFFLTFLPTIITKRFKIVLPWEIIFLIVLALFLHSLGFVFNLYHLPGWDVVTHFASSILIALLGFTIVVILDRYTKSIKLNKTSVAFLILIFTLSGGVIWELGEFAYDSLVESTQQGGYLDTMRDLLVDLIGGLFIAIIGTTYLGYPSIKTKELVEKFNVERLLQREKPKAKKLKKRNWPSFFSKLVPISILIVGVYFLIKRDYFWWAIALVSILFAFSPMIIRKHFIFLPWELSFLIFLFLGLHLSANIITSILNLESITRFVYSGMVATFGFIGVVILDKHSPSLKVNPNGLPFFIIMFVLAAGALLEIGEFFYLNYFGFSNPTNYSIMIDFIYDLVAGLVIALPGTLYLKYVPDKRFAGYYGE